MTSKALVIILIALLGILWIVVLCFAMHYAQDFEPGQKFYNEKPIEIEIMADGKDGRLPACNIRIIPSDTWITFWTTQDRMAEFIELIQTFNCKVDTVWYEKTDEEE